MLKMFQSSAIYKNYAKIFPYIKPYGIRAMLAVLVTIPIGSADAVIAWSLKPYMDVVMVEKNLNQTWYIPFLIIIFSIIQSLLIYTATYLNTWVGRKISNDVKADLYNKLMRYDSAYFDKNTSGNILLRFNNDVDIACNGLLSNLKLFTTRLFSSISLIGVLFYNSWQLALIAVSVFLGALYPLTTVRRRIKSVSDKSVFSGAEVVTCYNETFNGNKIISSYNLFDYQNKRFQNTLNYVFKLGIKMVQRTGILSPIMHFIVSLGIASVIWVGSYFILTHQISAGNFVSFIAAMIMLYNPIKSIGNNYNNVQMSLLAMDRIFDIQESLPNITNKAQAKEFNGIKDKIVYEGVCFGYEPDKSVLENINLTIKAGEKIAFVGNSGGGKTTIVSLLSRFYDVTAGSISIDGVNIKDYDLESLRKNIAVVFQDNFLFSGTIRENILLGNLNATKSEIECAIKCACLEDFIASLECGIDTYIGERGVLLSGGQKQRIAIARAFIKNAPIVILDEATSALDNKSEKIVQQALDNLMKNRTVLIVAHRLSTIKYADKIVVINDGKIAETGTHIKLLQKENGIYSELYKVS